MTRAFHREYFVGKGKKPVLVHVIREDGTLPGKQGECSAPGWSGGAGAGVVVLDPMPAEPPEGFTWCPTCIGKLADRLGVLNEVAERVVEEVRRRAEAGPDAGEARAG